MLQSEMCRSLGCVKSELSQVWVTSSLGEVKSGIKTVWVKVSLGFVFLGYGILGYGKSGICQSGKRPSTFPLENNELITTVSLF